MHVICAGPCLHNEEMLSCDSVCHTNKSRVYTCKIVLFERNIDNKFHNKHKKLLCKKSHEGVLEEKTGLYNKED